VHLAPQRAGNRGPQLLHYLGVLSVEAAGPGAALGQPPLHLTQVANRAHLRDADQHLARLDVRCDPLNDRLVQLRALRRRLELVQSTARLAVDRQRVMAVGAGLARQRDRVGGAGLLDQ